MRSRAHRPLRCMRLVPDILLSGTEHLPSRGRHELLHAVLLTSKHRRVTPTCDMCTTGEGTSTCQCFVQDGPTKCNFYSEAVTTQLAMYERCCK